jgi:hypothetical protein
MTRARGGIPKQRSRAQLPVAAQLVVLAGGMLVSNLGAALLERAAPFGMPAQLLTSAVLALAASLAGLLVEAGRVVLARWSWLALLPLVAAFVVARGGAPVVANAAALAITALVAAAIVGVCREPQVAATAWVILGAMAAVMEGTAHTDTGALQRLDVPRSIISVGVEASHALDVAIVTNWFTLTWLALGVILWRAYRFPPRAAAWSRSVPLLAPIVWAVVAVTAHPVLATLAVTVMVIGAWWPLLVVSGAAPLQVPEIER